MFKASKPLYAFIQVRCNFLNISSAANKLKQSSSTHKIWGHLHSISSIFFFN